VDVAHAADAAQRLILEDGPEISAAALPFAAGASPFRSATAFPDQPASEGTGHWRALGNGRFVPELRIPSGGTSLEAVERELVADALRQTQGNQSRAARLLDVSRDTIRYAMKKYGLGADDVGGGE
jgi:DNA-binding NtrC family response regulator